MSRDLCSEDTHISGGDLLNSKKIDKKSTGFWFQQNLEINRENMYKDMALHCCSFCLIHTLWSIQDVAIGKCGFFYYGSWNKLSTI